MKPSLNNPWWVYVSLVVWAIVIIFIILALTLRTPFVGENELVLLVSAVSLLVSFYAFIVGYKTYASIDSVNAKSIMEGNLVENSHYCTNIYQLFSTYPHANREEVLQAIYDNYSQLGQSVLKGAELADKVQSLIDLVFLFPAFYLKGNDSVDARMNRLIDNASHDITALNQMNSGSVRLLEETLALFSASYSAHLDYTRGAITVRRSILDVCGTMFKNPSSLIVYHYYYGRSYLAASFSKLARNVLHLQEGSPLLSDTSIRALRELSVSKEDTEEILILLQAAETHFKKASEILEVGPAWEDTICLNRGYTLAFMEIISGRKREWEQQFDQAIIARVIINQIIDSLKLDEDNLPYLAGYFRNQLVYAKEQKQLFCSTLKS